MCSSRQVLNLSIGARVAHKDQVYEIRQVLDYDIVVGVNLATGVDKAIRVKDLSPVPVDADVFLDLEEMDSADLDAARFRLEAIRPLLNVKVGRHVVEQRAREVGVHYSTLYRWLRRYEGSGSLESLLPRKRGRRRGERRLSQHVEDIIEEVIKQVYMTRQRSSAQKVVSEVRRVCMNQEISPPHANTIRARISAIHPRERAKSRLGRQQALDRFAPAAGSFPNADYPLAYVQIDHTPADVMLVDDQHRLPVGRPWITLAIDVYSRSVVGFHVSFDEPSETSVALCVAHAVLVKDEWLAQRGLSLEWPMYGLMNTIHVDNGAEFRSSNFRDACALHGINLEYRPVRQPRFGGHIERMLGTLLKEIHDLPGTTFSSVAERGEYQPDRHAAMTLMEFEAWLATLICKVYHQRIHSGIGMTPTKQWEIGLFGNEHVSGRGLPSMPGDPQSFLLDFLPRFKRTVQQDGVTIDGLSYYADVLRPWIGALDPDHPKSKRKFIFRRDPRDISQVWFFDPELRRYFRVPFADQSLPSMSAWEYRKARERAREDGMKSVDELPVGALYPMLICAREDGMKSVDERRILDALGELREMAKESASRSRKARRTHQKRREHEKQAKRSLLARTSDPKPETETDDDIFNVTEPLGEIE